jgi:phosphohistidine swiveling domain-containing protein
MMKHFVVSLDSRAALRESCAGGKGASLARLRRQGFAVPRGFAITSTAFQEFLADFGIEVLTQRREWIESDLEHIRELITSCRIPDHLVVPIARAYRKLGGPVAVRSSMVGEDAYIASFAGQLDSALNVKGEKELLRAVKKCWASVFNWCLYRYLTKREAASPSTLLECFSVAVVVQHMVDAQAAGVAFSADPLTGERCVLIEAVRGLGDALVQGMVEADRYVVDARGVLAEAAPVNVGSSVLHDEQILCLSDIVRDVARRAETPQDIEWAWDGAGFYLLQSRPITSLVGKRIYSNKMVADMSPGLIKPLVYSTKTVSMTKNVFGRIFTELIGPNDVDFAALAACIHSRVYTDLTTLGELFERIGLPANFFEAMLRDERPDVRPRSLSPRVLRTLLRFLGFVWHHSRVADEIAAFVQRHARDLERFRCADWSSCDPQELLAEFERLTQLHGECQWFVFIGPINLAIRNRLLGRLTRRCAPDVAPGDLIQGLVGLKALEPNRKLQEMAAQARMLGEDARCALMEGSEKPIRAALSASDEGRALLQNMDSFMERYGFLSANGSDFTETPWIENTSLIWRAVGRAAANPGESVVKDAKKVRREACRQIRARLSWPQRLLFDRLLDSTVTYIDLREQTSLLMSEDSYQMRRIFVAVGECLAARGHLGQPDDVFYLTYDEVRQLAMGELEADVAWALVGRRRTELEADACIELPSTICGEAVPVCPVVPAEGQNCLVGIGGSSGIAHGRACVIVDPADAPATLTRDHILVVPFTDVGWTPLFPGIGGIVAETGGQLSHTSIVAREYGLPAVVGVKRATLLIRDGQPITVDGHHGQVYLRRGQDTC